MIRLMIAGVMALSGAASAHGQDFAAAGKPGPEHDRLKAFVGKWDLTMEGGQGKGSVEFKSIFGGRFITEEAKIPFGGFSMEWMGIYGYDKNKKKYTAVWVDNMDTTTETGEADADAEGKALTFRGEHIDPRSGKLAKFIWRLSCDGDTKLAIEMFDFDAGGKERKVMTIRGEKAKQVPAGRIPR